MNPLPIDSYLKEISQSLANQNNLVLSATPGAGKTTRLPPHLLSLTDKKILVLEPRRIAAVSAAARVATENAWQLGSEVGYQIRFDANYSEDTRLIFLTEALLNRRLITDPQLEDVGIVILDEFHERSQHVDLAIGMLKELQSLARPDLKIIVMSATLQKENICDFLETDNYFLVPGQSFPLEIEYSKTPQKMQTGQDFIQLLADAIKQVHSRSDLAGHCLVFLPGMSEIERLADSLDAWALNKHLQVHKLHGNLSLEQQQLVLQSSLVPKIILSTNIAESSLTIDGVHKVIDCGLQRRASINPKTGFPQLELARISQSSAAQRAGRAARQGPGYCLRMWSKLDQQSMPAEETAEILRVDLAESLLFLAEAGISDPKNFSWFTKPKVESLSKAQRQLHILGAVHSDGSISDLGKKLLRWPLPPRLAHLMELADQMSIGETGAKICALLTERDVLSGRSVLPNAYHNPEECDIQLRLELFSKNKNLERVFRQLKNLLTHPSRQANSEMIKRLLLLAFKDQLCRRRETTQGDSRRALMINGTGVCLDQNSCVKKSEYFVAISLMDGFSAGEARVSVASGIPTSWIESLGKSVTRKTIEFDEQSEKFLSVSEQLIEIENFGSIALGKPHIVPASPTDISAQLSEVAYKHFEKIVSKNQSLQNWWQRWSYFCRELKIEDPFNREVLKEIFEQACFGENALTALYSKDLVYFLEQQLTPELKNQLKKNCPEFFIAPTGSKIKIDYSEENPRIEIRLQELFGQTSTPSLLEGKKSLVLVLLGPHYRPIQVTQDLMSFWKNGYPEVRKELRTRYPKHSWPEDPLTAPPQAKGRPVKT